MTTKNEGEEDRIAGFEKTEMRLGREQRRGRGRDNRRFCRRRGEANPPFCSAPLLLLLFPSKGDNRRRGDGCSSRIKRCCTDGANDTDLPIAPTDRPFLNMTQSFVEPTDEFVTSTRTMF
jgi:hypothetical protein